MKNYFDISRSTWPLLGYLLLFSMCYLPVLISTYAFPDDYSYLHARLTDPKFPNSAWPGLAVAGRPLSILAWWYFSLFIHKIADLASLRFFGIVSLALLSFFLYRTMLIAGWRKSIAFLVPIIICTMPSFQVFISWSTISWTVLLAIISGVSVYIGQNAYLENKRSRKHLMWALSTISLFAALAFVQCNPMFFWVFVSIFLFRPTNMPSEYLNRFFFFLTIFLSACIGEFFITKLGQFMYGVDCLTIERTHLTHHIWKKIIWFIVEPLTNALNFGFIFSSSSLAWCIGLAILIGLAFYFRKDPIKILVALTLIPLCYLPNLAIAENWASYRTTAALSALLVLYGLFAIYGFAQTIFSKRRDSIVFVVFVVFTILACVQAYSTVLAYFVLPQTFELQLSQFLLRSQVDTNKIFALLNNISLAPGTRYDEFGCPVSAEYRKQKQVLDIIERE